MPNNDTWVRWQAQAPVFAALADETRLHLLARLWAQGPLSITALAEGSRVSRQAITKHLRVLSEAGLAKGIRRGRESVWKLERRGLRQAHHWLDRISRQWDERLERLRVLVED